jgi:hypothetical protein
MVAPVLPKPVAKGRFTAGFLARLLYEKKHVLGRLLSRIATALAADGLPVAEDPGQPDAAFDPLCRAQDYAPHTLEAVASNGDSSGEFGIIRARLTGFQASTCGLPGGGHDGSAPSAEISKCPSTNLWKA